MQSLPMISIFFQKDYIALGHLFHLFIYIFILHDSKLFQAIIDFRSFPYRFWSKNWCSTKFIKWFISKNPPTHHSKWELFKIFLDFRFIISNTLVFVSVRTFLYFYLDVLTSFEQKMVLRWPTQILRFLDLVGVSSCNIIWMSKICPNLKNYLVLMTKNLF